MPRIVAIDLGHHAVKACVLQTSGRTVTVEGSYTEPVAAMSADAEPVGEGAPLGARLAALDRLLTSHHAWQAPATTVGLVWPAGDAALRIVQLPFSDKAQVEQTLPFTVEELVPYDLDDMVLAWRGLPTQEGTRALVCLTQQERMATVVEALHQRNLDPRQVVLDGEAMGRLAPPDDVVAVVDVGHRRTTVSVVSGGQVVSSRAIDVAGWRFTQAIAGALEISLADAEALKVGAARVAADADDEPTDSGVVGSGTLPPAARLAVDGVFGLLLAEVRTSLIDVEDSQGLEITQVFLAGGGSRLSPLADYLERDLGLPVNALVDTDGDPVEVEYAAAMGLATALAEGARVVDLRVGKLAFKGGVNVLRAVVLYGASGMAFFLFASVIMFGYRYKVLHDAQRDATVRIRDVVMADFPDTNEDLLADSSDAALLMQGLVEGEEERAEKIAGTGQVPPTIDALYQLTRAFPPHEQVVVEVSDLTLSDTSITFNAQTDGYETASQVEASIQAVEAFAAAAKSNERRTRDKVQFTMTIPLVDEGAE